MKKHVQSQQGVAERQRMIDDLAKKKDELKNKEIELRCKLDAIDKKNKAKAEIDEKIRSTELDCLRHQGKEVGDFIMGNQEAQSPKQQPKPT